MENGADERDLEVGFPPEDDLEHLIEDYSHLAPPSEGELLQGHVVKITPTEAIVDVGHVLFLALGPDATLVGDGRRQHLGIGCSRSR